MSKIRQSLRNASKYLDADIYEEDPTIAKKEEVKEEIETMTPDELDEFSKWLDFRRHEKSKKSNESSPQMKQNNSLQKDTISLGHCQMEKLSSENKTRTPVRAGLEGFALWSKE